MLQPGRKFTSGSGYRYGFNKKEMDNEVNGGGNEYDYGFRIYNPRVGKFFSNDPLDKQYPYYSPYQFSGNSPISAIDIDGLEPKGYAYVSNNPNSFSFKKYDCKGAESRTVEGVGRVNGIMYRVTDALGKDFWTLERTTLEFYKDPLTGNNQSAIKTESFYFTKPPANSQEAYDGGKWLPYETTLEQQRRLNDQVHDGIGKGVFLGAVALAAAPVVAAISPSLSSTATYLTPKPGFNPVGGAWDLINQKVFQGKTWGDVNWGTVGTASAFGKGNLLSNSVWSSSGSFTNLSVNNIASGGSPLQLNQQGVISFGSNVIGNVLSGGTNGFFQNANKNIIKNPLERAIMNRLLSVPTDASGQAITNQIEKAATPNK